MNKELYFEEPENLLLKQKISIDEIAELIDFEDLNELINAIVNYADEDVIEHDLDNIPNTTRTWIEIAKVLNSLIFLDYTKKGDLQEYADEILDFTKYRIENNVCPDADFLIPERISQVESIINIFSKLLLKLKCLDPKTIYETAEKILDKSIFYDVAKEVGEDEEVIRNFCYFNGLTNQDNKFTTNAIMAGYADENGFTELGRNYIIEKFKTIKIAEKKIKPNELGKAE